MSSPIIFGVYTAKFPFLDTKESKTRPVVVVSRPHGQYKIVAVVPISSSAKPERVDCTLYDWESAGLAKSSVGRVHRLTTILEARLSAKLGELSPKDSDILKQSMREFLDL